ncbi:MAG: hypothetical protein AAGG51_03980 [Cyanobacteria bacterium P01_G01_bin.54]
MKLLKTLKLESLAVIGEAGQVEAKQAELAQAWIGPTATVDYQGSTKKWLFDIADQWHIADQIEKQTAENLKHEIPQLIPTGALLILPNAKRLPASLRYWLDYHRDIFRICAFEVCDLPEKDLWLHILRYELPPPTEREIRAEIDKVARKGGVELSRSRLAELASQAGRSPVLATKLARAELAGMPQTVSHAQYLDISPAVMAALFGFAILRFVGMGTGNKPLYILGGVCLTVAMAIKQLGKVKGISRRVGQ